MRKASVAKAKAHFSELVDLAEHKGQRIIVLRHGKPAAAIVPVAVAVEPRARMTPRQIDALMDRMIAAASGSAMTVEQALGRDRLEPVRR